MKTLYYYMPPCPKCGSEVTGRYIKKPMVKKDYIVMESLKNGEIVELTPTAPEKNAFCCTCGFRWKENPRLVRITPEEKEAEIARRGTEKLLHKYIEKNHIDLYKKPFLGGMFSGLIDFF